MKNQDIGRNWNMAFSASKPMWHGLSLRSAYSYGEAKNTIDPGSTANASWNEQRRRRPTRTTRSRLSRARRRAIASSCRRPTRSSTSGSARPSISAFWESRTLGNTSYVFAADANGDGGRRTT